MIIPMYLSPSPSTFIVLGLAGIGLNTLYEEELAEEEKQDERI